MPDNNSAVGTLLNEINELRRKVEMLEARVMPSYLTRTYDRTDTVPASAITAATNNWETIELGTWIGIPTTRREYFATGANNIIDWNYIHNAPNPIVDVQSRPDSLVFRTYTWSDIFVPLIVSQHNWWMN